MSMSMVVICRAAPPSKNAFKGLFTDNKGLKMCIKVNSVRFVTPDAAIEDGTSSAIPPDSTPPSQPWVSVRCRSACDLLS
jgi:hypothetical protein